MVNTINTLTVRNKELAEKVEELERKTNSFPSREQQLEVLNRIEGIAQQLKKRDKERKKEVGWMWKHKSYRLNTKTFKYHEKKATSEDGEDYSKIFIRDVAFHLWNEEQKRGITEKDNPLESYLKDLIHSFSYMTGRVIHYEGQLKELKNSRVGELTESLNHEKTRAENAEQKIKELEVRVEKLDDEVWMEREEAEKALDKAKEWRERQMFEKVLKHDAAMGKLLDRIDLLENNLSAKNQEINWRDHLENKELPALPKQQKQNKLQKFKQLVSKAKERTKERFQAFIVQKNK